MNDKTMSRSYRVEVEATGICVQELVKVMARFMWNDDWSTEKNGIAYFSSDGCLSGGQSEEEAHKQIYDELKQLNPQALIKTRWTYLEDLPYSEYGDDFKCRATKCQNTT